MRVRKLTSTLLAAPSCTAYTSIPTVAAGQCAEGTAPAHASSDTRVS